MTMQAWRAQLAPHGLPGKLLAIDGVDGSGKTTTSRLIRAYLRSQGIVVKGFKLPSRELKSSSWFIRYSRDPLAAVQHGDVDLLGMCSAVLGDRLITVRRSILPQLLLGRAVVVDRFLYTPLGELLIHGGGSAGWPVVEPLVRCFPKPDLTVFTDVSADEAMKRVHSREYEAEDRLPGEVYVRRVSAFRKLAEANVPVLLDTSAGLRHSFELLLPHLRTLCAADAGDGAGFALDARRSCRLREGAPPG